MCFSRPKTPEHLKHQNMGSRSPKSGSTTSITKEKVLVWCAGLAIGVAGKYDLNGGRVRTVDYYQMLYIYLRSEAHHFCRVLLFGRPELLLTLNERFVLIFTSCFRTHGWKMWTSRPTIQIPRISFTPSSVPGIFKASNVLEVCSRLNAS